MQPTFAALHSMLYCPYKAWKLSSENITANFEMPDPVSSNAKVAYMAWELSRLKKTNDAPASSKSLKQLQQAQKLLSDSEMILNKTDVPPFYKVAECSACQFKHDCLIKLKARDCISLLPGMTPNVRARYSAKGITTITQLSYLFRPRRRRQSSPSAGSYLWDLKALAIREQKTFVLHPPELTHHPVSIYLDFEGTDEGHHYLLGGIITQEGKPDETFYFWSDNSEQADLNFQQLFALLQRHAGSNIYHFGSYETKALKQAVKKHPHILEPHWDAIEKRMVNLLGYLRTHVYPPTYGNGLKELGAFLGFRWSDPEVDGIVSMEWRKQWEATGWDSWKNKLIQYNLDDCRALCMVHQWFCHLTLGAAQENVQQVAQMKKHTPYRLQNNTDYGEDFQLISKASYFDYQRNKIYWRNELKRQSPAASSLSLKPKQSKKGTMAWHPKKVNEVIIIPPLKQCPHCGHTKLYQSRKIKTSVKQTDLKFTVSGIKQHVVEYRSGIAKCAKCATKTNNKNLRIMHYGDNLLALVINYYVNYHISHEMISKLLQEHYGIWVSQMYLVMYKNKWWNRRWEPVAGYIKEIVLKSPVIHIDETTIKLARESGYVWVFATTHSVFYHYTSTRETGFLQELLKDYKGIIISDFFAGYETLDVKRQKCLIHLIRDLNDDLFKNPFDEEYKLIVAGFNKLLRKIIETIDKHGLQKVHLSKHIKDTEVFFKTIIEPDHTGELSVKYIKRLKKHWEELWIFLQHDNVPWNNNNAEAAVKAFAQHRRGVKGQMHVRGLREYLQMLSVSQTCRYRNISFLSFLRKKKGIWENVLPKTLPGFLPFDQARLFVQKLGFERKAQWNQWKTESRPSFIPSAPEKTYKDNGWIDWHDWMGFSFLPFKKARTFMRKL
jgi:hypothetical protein